MYKLLLWCSFVAAAWMVCAVPVGIAHGPKSRVTENPAARSADWPSAGQDWHNTGHNPRERILTPETVGGLDLLWEHNFSPAPGFSVPVIATPTSKPRSSLMSW